MGRITTVLIVGEAPGRAKGIPGLIGSRARLARLAGIPPEVLVQQHGFVNLLDEWPGKDGKGDGFDAVAAARRARMIQSVLSPGAHVVLLGRRVAHAWGLHHQTPLLTWMPHGDTFVAIVPHPSGINRWWNDPDNSEAGRAFLRSSLNGR